MIIGAIAGDIIGSRFEFNNLKSKGFELFTPECKFTDDSIMTLALCEAYCTGSGYQDKMVEFYKLYPNAGYGKRFKQWCNDPSRGPYNSFGNGAGMRIGPCAYVRSTLESCLNSAQTMTETTHNHAEGIKGAKAIAGCTFLARTGKSMTEIREFAESLGYPMAQVLDEIRPDYKFDVSCQGSVPWAIQAFLESTNYEDAIRNAISIGGDSDTLACMAGAIAGAYYKDLGIDKDGVSIADKARCFLDGRLTDVLDKFELMFS